MSKTRINDDPGLWEDEVGRLVMITCLQRPSGRSTDNVVIVAERD